MSDGPSASGRNNEKLGLNETQLLRLKAGDRVTIQSGARTWTATIAKVSANLIYTDGRKYHRRTGLAWQSGFSPSRIIDRVA